MSISLLVASVISMLLLSGVDSFTFPLRQRQTSTLSTLKMSIDQFDALLFDCDGVIAETERDVHRISFNEAFRTKGLTNTWDVEKYGKPSDSLN